MSGKKVEERVLARATYRYAGMSPRKIRLYADLIRGKTADVAMQLLSFEITRSARLMEKVLKSLLTVKLYVKKFPILTGVRLRLTLIPI